MKKLFTLIMVISITLSVSAQSPEKMSYQCVVRNPSGVLITNQSVGIRISILQGTPSGTVIYQETYSPNPQTNANGLVTVEIGGGFPITGTFSAINWAAGPYFLRTETDPTGGTSYTIVGTSQLLSVPYALHAKAAATADYNTLSNLPTLNIANWNTAYGWGNHTGLYRPISYVPSWSDITSKPTTIAGYGITNAMSTSHPANGITSGNITNWNTAYGWGNHAGLYRPVGWVPAWTDVTGKPTFAAVATSGNYNDLTNKPTLPGVAHINPTSFQSWSDGAYQIQTLATLTMNIPASGWVLLIHTGDVTFFSQNRTMDAGIGTSSSTMLNSVNLGYLDGSSTLRYRLPYTVTTLVTVTPGSRTFYALGQGNSTFSSGGVNMEPISFTGIFFPSN